MVLMDENAHSGRTRKKCGLRSCSCTGASIRDGVPFVSLKGCGVRRAKA